MDSCLARIERSYNPNQLFYPLEPKTHGKRKVLNHQNMGYNPAKMKVVGSHGKSNFPIPISAGRCSWPPKSEPDAWNCRSLPYSLPNRLAEWNEEPVAHKILHFQHSCLTYWMAGTPIFDRNYILKWSTFWKTKLMSGFLSILTELSGDQKHKHHNMGYEGRGGGDQEPGTHFKKKIKKKYIYIWILYPYAYMYI